jgi:hypothetical protein
MATPLLTRGASYGLRDIKISNLAETSSIRLGAATEMEMTEILEHAVLRGNDAVVAASSRLTHIELSFTDGYVDFTKMALLTNDTISTSTASAAPTATDEIDAVAGQCYPYFRLRARVVEAGCNRDLHVVIYKCMLSSGMESTFANGQFFTPSVSAVGIGDSGNVDADGNLKIRTYYRYSSAQPLTTSPTITTP